MKNTLYSIKTYSPLERKLTDDEITFIAINANRLNVLYGESFNWHSFDFVRFASRNRVTICYRQGSPCGVMLAQVGSNVFDPDTKTLKQVALYATAGTLAAYYLLRDFVDFGKSNANHIVTVIGDKTNIKASSLKRLGFNKIEEVYSIEV